MLLYDAIPMITQSNFGGLLLCCLGTLSSIWWRQQLIVTNVLVNYWILWIIVANGCFNDT